jgi:WD40 repeat protein
MTLASAGRGPTKLWDVATGRLLLNLAGRSYTLALALSPDGKRIAVSSAPAFGVPGDINVWKLQNGRGVSTLRGLTSRVMRVGCSHDGRLVAALAEPWELAVWDLQASRLLHVIEPPQGFLTDNAAVAFSPDGKQLAYSSGTQAMMWDVESGKELRSWKDFPPGLGDRLAFHNSGKLVQFRFETEGKKYPPFANFPPDKHPRVCRIRELTRQNWLEPVKEIKDLNWHVFGAAAALDGSVIVVEGRGGERGRTRLVKAFDGLTGKELWAKRSRRTHDNASLCIDPAGKLLAVVLRDDLDETVLMDIPSGGEQESVEERVSALSPNADYMTGGAGFNLYRRRLREPLLRLCVDAPNTGFSQFSPAGTHFIWGNGDGSINVCNLVEVQQRLAKANGLDW